VSFEVRFPPQPPTDAAGEVVEVEFASAPGAPSPPVERMRIQDYEHVFAVPGLYEEIVQRRLGCRTPDRMAALLARAAARLGWEPAGVRILDAGAGNGVSGEAFAARGMRPVVGLDILPAARDAALRDRPGVYGAYLAADLRALAPAEERLIRDAAPNALACVGSVGRGHLPAEAVAAALELLARDALVAYAFDIELGADPLRDLLRDAEPLARERALHRRTVTGGERHWEAVVVRLARP
jgi:predicted TPR repeat methyltransferase